MVERADRICTIGLKAWHDQEAIRDEEVVRRLLEVRSDNMVEGGSDMNEGRRETGEMDDETASRLLRWVLDGNTAEEEEVIQVLSQGEAE